MLLESQGLASPTQDRTVDPAQRGPKWGGSLGCRVRGGGWGAGGGTCSLALLWAACPQSLRPPSLCVKGLPPLPSLIPFFPASDFSSPGLPLRVQAQLQEGEAEGRGGSHRPAD